MTFPRHRLLTALVLITMAALACPAVQAQGCQVRAIAALPAKLVLEGQAVQAIACKDAEGEHLFVETRAQPEPVRGKAQPQVLSFYKFTLGSGQPQKRWQARDFLTVDDSARASATAVSTARADRFVVKDVDGDGVTEAFIAYALPGKAGAGSEGKLLVFYKDRKYAIRGAVAHGPDDFASRTLDPAFQTLPVSVQTFALGLWDQVAMPHGPGGVAVTQAALR
ncbi:MAG TPA: hypothetical protein H9903_06760 [Candidatus Aquabacterium excrementipullorum]|nr:hypothetical protein [Candidatus Aquabacterium excrementipullorum]